MEVKEKLISSIHKGITIAEIKGRDKSPFFRRIIHFFTFPYSVGVKEYILLNVLQKYSVLLNQVSIEMALTFFSVLVRSNAAFLNL